MYLILLYINMFNNFLVVRLNPVAKCNHIDYFRTLPFLCLSFTFLFFLSFFFLSYFTWYSERWSLGHPFEILKWSCQQLNVASYDYSYYPLCEKIFQLLIYSFDSSCIRIRLLVIKHFYRKPKVHLTTVFISYSVVVVEYIFFCPDYLNHTILIPVKFLVFHYSRFRHHDY